MIYYIVHVFIQTKFFFCKGMEWWKTNLFSSVKRGTDQKFFWALIFSLFYVYFVVNLLPLARISSVMNGLSSVRWEGRVPIWFLDDNCGDQYIKWAKCVAHKYKGITFYDFWRWWIQQISHCFCFFHMLLITRFISSFDDEDKEKNDQTKLWIQKKSSKTLRFKEMQSLFNKSQKGDELYCVCEVSSMFLFIIVRLYLLFSHSYSHSHSLSMLYRHNYIRNTSEIRRVSGREERGIQWY